MRRSNITATAVFALSLWSLPGCGDASESSPVDTESSKLEAGAGPDPAYGHGARVVEERSIDARMVDLTIVSPALGGQSHARLLLPKHWGAPHRSWPVLYLLHGCCDDYTSWTRETDIAALTADLDVLVVMPEAGQAGWYSDWWNQSKGGPPRWETYHLVEVREILERGYHAGARRAIAGLSMGGFGAISYAARHPGMFRAAASFSGIVHSRMDGGPQLVQSIVSGAGEDPLALWGDPVAQRPIWQAHNPYDLADRLVGIPIYIASGNGDPGPLDPPEGGHDSLEHLLGDMNTAFAQRLRALGADATIHLYGPGTHSWPYWQRELHTAFPMLMDAIGVD
ncbi:esterase family protein [Pendulispora rubella]|uniref:Esterase family protein n=1 Tax=Pendulispora rubella TaxID=2741070 RepID=A0ABZ2KTI8_9BACT